jgi:hypothetical protein
MLAKADAQLLVTPSAQDASQHGRLTIGKKIWLPGLLYDGLPYFYLTAGFAAFFTTLYISDWFWILPHYLLFSAACIHLALSVFRLRRNGSARTLAGSAADKGEDPNRA